MSEHKREGAAGHQMNICPLLNRRENGNQEMIQVPRETLEAMAEALSWPVAADWQGAVGPVDLRGPRLEEAIQARRELFQEIQAHAELRALCLFGDCLPLSFIHALSLEIQERGTL